MSEQMEPDLTSRMAVAAAIRAALIDKGVMKEDPAFLVLECMEYSLRALEEIPRALEEATARRLSILDTQIKASAIAAKEMQAKNAVSLDRQITRATTNAVNNAARLSYESAREQIKARSNNMSIVGFTVGIMVLLFSEGLCYRLGEAAATGRLRFQATGLLSQVQQILSAPIGLAIAPALITGIVTVIFSLM